MVTFGHHFEKGGLKMGSNKGLKNIQKLAFGGIQTKIYFDISDVESDKEEATNDVDGKYFKRMCYFEGDCEIGDDTIPENYYDLPVEEQLSICKSLEDKGIEISYGVTRLCETEKFFDITAWRRS